MKNTQVNTVSMTFDPFVAKDVGTDAAIILYNIAYWVKKEESEQKKDKHHDGRYWTYNSATAFHKLFTWLTPRQISRNLEKLEKKGYLIVGNYNKNRYDQTKWYSLGDKYEKELIHLISPNDKMDSLNMSNGLVNNDQPIPNIKPNKSIYINKQVNSSSLTKKDKIGFVPALTDKPNNEFLSLGKKKSTGSFSPKQAISESLSNTLTSNSSMDENINYSDYLKLENNYWISYYKSELGSGKQALIPLTQDELIEMSKLTNINLKDVCNTHKQALEYSGGRYRSTWDKVEKFIQNNVAKGYLISGLDEIQIMQRDELSFEKIMARKKLRKYQQELIEQGIL